MAMMQGRLSFVDVIGVIGFVWSFISFYIGYIWYRDGAAKDSLVAKLTAENELLRREIDAISSVDSGRRREVLGHLRSIDKAGLERASRFYPTAYSFSRSRRDSTLLYEIFVYAVSLAVILYFSESVLITVFILYPIALAGTVLLFPVNIVFFNHFMKSRAATIQKLLDNEGFSFQEVLGLREWLDQQEWHDRKLKERLTAILNANMTRLENLATAHQVQSVSAHTHDDGQCRARQDQTLAGSPSPLS
jgi:hypothetical protein